MQRQINEKKQELLAKEESLRCVWRGVSVLALLTVFCAETWKVAWLLRGRSPNSATEGHVLVVAKVHAWSIPVPFLPLLSS